MHILSGLTGYAGFDWDAGNRAKCRKHGLSTAQIEQLFETAIAVLPDSAHSEEEPRFRAIGRGRDGRAVFVVFTMRRRGEDWLIRPISARYMHRKEIASYEKENPDLQGR
jgi:uncharacterized DUF497 family protein